MIQMIAINLTFIELNILIIFRMPEGLKIRFDFEHVYTHIFKKRRKINENILIFKNYIFHFIKAYN